MRIKATLQTKDACQPIEIYDTCRAGEQRLDPRSANSQFHATGQT
jgi:hypothetical protein